MQYLMQLAQQFQIRANEIGLDRTIANNTTLENIITAVYMVLAAVATFFIIRGGLLYITDGNDPSYNKQARETIIYAVVALAGSTMVFALIQFVIEVI